MRRWLAALLALAGCEPSYVIGGAEQSSQTSGSPGACQPGDWPTAAGEFTRTVRFQGADRVFRVVTPAGYDPCKASPVLVVLRGQGAFVAPDESLWESYFYARASADGHVVVEPQATQVKLLAEWNAPLAPEAVASVDDVGFVGAMLGEIRGRDPEKTFLLGWGDGGTFAHSLAARLPVFSAMVVVNGTLGGRRSADAPLEIPPTPLSPLSVLLVHGRDDAVFPIQGGLVGGRVLLGVPDAEAFWVAADQCTEPPTSSKTGRVSVRSHACPAGRSVHVVALDGVGHWWPEDAISLRFRLSQVAFEFFSRNTL